MTRNEQLINNFINSRFWCLLIISHVLNVYISMPIYGKQKTMVRISKKRLSQIVEQKIQGLQRLDRLNKKIELIESEIKDLVGENFDPYEFFDDAGFAAEDDIRATYGDEEYADFGSMEDAQSFIKGLNLASDEDAEKYAPEYFAEKRIVKKKP